MRVKELTLYRVNIPFKTSITHSLKKRQCSESIVLELQTTDGYTGYGEGAPRPYVTGETVETIAIQARASLRPLLKQKLNSLNDVEQIVRSIQHDYQLPSLASAVEIALLDIWGQKRACSLTQVFEINKHFRPTYSAVLPFLPLQKMEKWLYLIKTIGFQQIKLKVGHENDEQYVALLRKELGDEVDIRLDANRAWSMEQAVDKIARFEQYNISSIEEPLSVSDLYQLPMLSQKMNTPIMLDESVCSMVQAAYYCNKIPAHKLRFNLKLSKMGGILATSRIHAFALANGIECQLGCNVGETAILSAVGRIFAQQHRLIALEGSYASFFMEDDISMQPINFGKKGIAEPIIGHGIGTKIDKEKLQQYSQVIYTPITTYVPVSA